MEDDSASSRAADRDEAGADEPVGAEISATTSQVTLSQESNLQPINGASVAVRESSLAAGAPTHIVVRAVPGHLSSVQHVQKLLSSVSGVDKYFTMFIPQSNGVHAGAWKCVSSAGIDALGLVGDSSFRTVLERHSGGGASTDIDSLACKYPVTTRRVMHV